MTGTASKIEIGKSLVDAGDRAGVEARLLGGIGVAIHSPSAALPAFEREYDDIDIAIEKKGRKRFDAIAAECGFDPDVEFNNFNGAERRIYEHPEHGKLDVFVGEFAMCHVLRFDDRLGADSPTLPLADLFLTKAQIYQLNRKDAYDLMVLLLDHRLGSGDDDVINTDRISAICGGDWGFWRTVVHTLDLLDEHISDDAELAPYREALATSVGGVREVLEDAPKSSKWKWRAKVGDRKAWYVLPEDPDRAVA